MLLLLLTLLQPQQPRISRVVIAGAIIVFVGGVSLLVYFYRRYKRIEKDPEEDWDLSRRSLFVNVPPPQKTEAASDLSGAGNEISAPVPEMPPAMTGATREFASGIELAGSAPLAGEPEIEPAVVREPAPEVRVEQSAPREPAPDVREVVPQVVPKVEPPPASRPTEILASLSPAESVTTETKEPTVFDEGVWAGLEPDKQSPLGQEGPALTATLQSAEPPKVARVEHRSHREPFEAPRIERVESREPYETPRIERLTPREEAAGTQQLRSVPRPQPEKASEDRDQTRQALGTGLFGSLPSPIPASPVTPSGMTGETRELVAADGSAARVIDRSGGENRARNSRSGSVLGLPSEPSFGPLILGDVVRNSSDVGIDALSNYGKDVGPKGGRGGTIALLVVVALIGGAVLLYLFVPSVHSRVGALVGQVRGTDTVAAQEAAMKPKVQIIPSYRPDVNKNLVTARGAVDNISDEQLENLSIEVSLQRGGDTPPEVRTVSVSPNPLPPNQRGTFEFEYDGKRDTGFTGYKITRVLSNNTEIKFRAPGK